MTVDLTVDEQGKSKIQEKSLMIATARDVLELSELLEFGVPEIAVSHASSDFVFYLFLFVSLRLTNDEMQQEGSSLTD